MEAMEASKNADSAGGPQSRTSRHTTISTTSNYSTAVPYLMLPLLNTNKSTTLTAVPFTL